MGGSEYGLTSNDRLTNHSSHHTCFATFDFTQPPAPAPPP